MSDNYEMENEVKKEAGTNNMNSDEKLLKLVAESWEGDEGGNDGIPEEKVDVGISINIKKLLQVVAICASLCFFMPMTMVSCGTSVIEISGVDATLGFEAMGQYIEGSVFYALLLLIPLWIFISVWKREFLI